MFQGGSSSVFQSQELRLSEPPFIGAKLALALEVQDVCQCRYDDSPSSSYVPMTLGDARAVWSYRVKLEVTYINDIVFSLNAHANQRIQTRSIFDNKKLIYL